MAKVPHLFVVFEGIDGSGQTTQGKMLAAWFEDQKISCWLTAEPTDSSIGQRIRVILKKQEKATPAEIQDLMMKDREGHVGQIISHLDRGEAVVCVRYIYSTAAYGTADGLDMERLIIANGMFLRPTVAIYLDLSVGQAGERIEQRGKSKEIFEEGDYPTKVHMAYNKLLQDPRFPELVRVDASGTPEEVHARVVDEVQKVLEKTIV